MSRFRRPVKLRFRAILLLTLLGLVLVAAAAVGLSSYFNTRFTAEDLSNQVLLQTSARIEENVLALLQHASLQSRLTVQLLLRDEIPRGQPIDAKLFPRITAYFYEVMRTHPQYTFLSLGLEATGEYCHVERKLDGGLIIQECLRTPNGTIERTDYELRDDGKRHAILIKPDWGYDPRTRPYYRLAREAKRQEWTPTYIFVNDPSPDTPGVTCATPLYDKAGGLIGVMSADFNLGSLCDFLKTIQVGREGFAVVVEALKDGSMQVIAHPDVTALIKQVGMDHWLMPIDELKDPRIRALMKQLVRLRQKGELGKLERIQFKEDNLTYLGSYRRLKGQDYPPWLVCTVVPEAEIMGRVNWHNKVMVTIGLASLLAATLVSLRLSAQVAKPLEELAQETESIGHLELESRPVVRSKIREVDRLARATEEMKTGLRSFRKYVPAELVRSLLATGQEASLGVEKRVVTICFSDIADFTSIAERLSPEAMAEMLGEYLAVLSETISKSQGTIDKYIGDSVMAFWGAPAANPRHALDACTATLRCAERLRELRPKWEQKSQLPVVARFGLHTGEVLVGNIGSETRMNYTVIGDSVNLASRIEGLNKHFRTQMVMTEHTWLEVREAVVARPLNWVAVKGRDEAVLVYELLGLRREVEPSLEEFAGLCSEALSSYSRQEWARAIDRFEQALAIQPNDLATLQMIARCRNYQARPPGENWDKAHRLDTK